MDDIWCVLSGRLSIIINFGGMMNKGVFFGMELFILSFMLERVLFLIGGLSFKSLREVLINLL